MCWKYQQFHSCYALVKLLIFSTHSIKYIWYSPQKSKYPLYIHSSVIVFRVWCNIFMCMDTLLCFSVIFFKGRQLLWLPACVSGQGSPSKMGSALKGKNLLLREQILFCKSWSPLRQEAKVAFQGMYPSTLKAELQIRGGIKNNWRIIFLISQLKHICCDPTLEHVLMMGLIIHFKGVIWKIIAKLSFLPLLNWSTGI